MYFVFIASTLAVIANFLVQKWIRGNIPLFVPMTVYTVASLCWIYAQKKFDVSKGVVLYMLVELLCAIAMGVFLFEQRLSSLNWVGVVLGVISVICITR